MEPKASNPHLKFIKGLGKVLTFIRYNPDGSWELSPQTKTSFADKSEKIKEQLRDYFEGCGYEREPVSLFRFEGEIEIYQEAYYPSGIAFNVIGLGDMNFRMPASKLKVLLAMISSGEAVATGPSRFEAVFDLGMDNSGNCTVTPVKAL